MSILDSRVGGVIKVILLRSEDIVSGRRYEFRELRRLHRLNEIVNNVAFGCLYDLIPSTPTDVIAP